MNEQTPNPNATNEGINEQAAVSSLPVSPESKPEVATSYPSCSAAPLPWPSGFSWAAHIFKAGRSLLALGSNPAFKPTRLRRAAYLGR